MGEHLERATPVPARWPGSRVSQNQQVAEDPASLKRTLRRAARERRRRRSPGERTRVGERLVTTAEHEPLRSARTVACFVGVGDEPPTLPLIERLSARGTRVLLPLVQADLDLDWAWFSEALQLDRTPHGLWEPTGPAQGKHAIAVVDVVLVPAFAVDGDGRRLGQGGGCYDRALRRVPSTTPVLAVVYEDEVSAQPLPEEAHDRRVDGTVLTLK